ncbi:prolyl-tRNA synthetase associated domain-containing protein [Candidatus Woesearchaeota archaeon]|jgi:Ala-tRNA(Pro) deacylase|nr:prolyl-tRNA synthetase associated domain-containing protein [Candidatus Woesearchaeota archaeon]
MLINVQRYLEANGIKYVEHCHQAVFTVAESKEVCKHIPGVHCKNLFLKDKKKDYFLVIVPTTKRVDLKLLEKELGVKKLGFGSSERLIEILNLLPGSVSPLGLMNDKKQLVTPIIDQAVWDAAIVGFHPNENTATLELDKENFHKLISSFPHDVVVLDVPKKV